MPLLGRTGRGWLAVLVMPWRYMEATVLLCPGGIQRNNSVLARRRQYAVLCSCNSTPIKVFWFTHLRAGHPP